MVDAVPFSFREERTYLDVVTQDATVRCKVLDDATLGTALHTDKVKEIVSKFIAHKKIDLANHIEKRSIHIHHSEHQIAGSTIPIVLQVKTVNTSVLAEITRRVKRIVSYMFGSSSPLTRHITAEFRKAVSLLPQPEQEQILQNLRITDAEHYFLKFIGTQIDFQGYSEQDKLSLFIEMLRGAYIQIEDGGECYNRWVKDIQDKVSRDSSHSSSDTQYAIRGPFLSECLFSKKVIVENGKEREVTWFQFERYPSSLRYMFFHVLSFVRYRITGQNQGPMGASSHTERHDPIVLRYKSSR